MKASPNVLIIPQNSHFRNHSPGAADKLNMLGMGSINSINSIYLGGMDTGSVAISDHNNLIQKSTTSFSSQRLMGFAEKLK